MLCCSLGDAICSANKTSHFSWFHSEGMVLKWFFGFVSLNLKQCFRTISFCDLMNYNYRLASFYIHKTRKCTIVYIVWWWVKNWHRPNYIVAMVAYIFNCTSEMFYIVGCPFLIFFLFVHFGTKPPCMVQILLLFLQCSR